jgi:MFS family permease
LIAGRLWLMKELSDSPTMLGLVTASSLGPTLLLTMWGGVMADRVNRTKLIMVTRVLFATIAFATGILITFELITPWHIIVTSLATSILLAFDIPSRQAMVANLVPKHLLPNAISLYALLPGGASVIGPALLSPTVTVIGLEGLFFLVGIAYLLTVFSFALIKTRAISNKSQGHSIWHNLKQGVFYIRDQRQITSLILIAIVFGVFGMSFTTLLPIFADKVFQGGLSSYSLLLLAEGVGGLLGAIVITKSSTIKSSINLFIVGAVGFSLTLMLFSQSGSLTIGIGIINLVGVTSVMFNTLNNVVIQTLVSEEYRGRVMSIHQFTWGSTAIGGLLLGYLTSIISAPTTLLLSSILLCITTIIWVLINPRKHFFNVTKIQ